MKKLVLLLFVVAACGGGHDSQPCTDGTPPTCDGDQLIVCQNGATATTDCAAMSLSCGDSGDAIECVDACDVAGVGVAPACAAGGVASCEADADGVDRVVVTACDTGQTCVGGACVADSCALVGPSGRCNGDVLTTCAGATPASVDCAASGEVCAYVDAATGYACVASTHGKVVRGFVRYEDRPPQLDGSLGAIQTMPVRGATVVVVQDSTVASLAIAITADDGSYELHYDADDGTMVHVSAAARNPTSARPGQVQTLAGQVHGFGGPSFAAAATADSDVLVTDASHESEAFNVLDQVTNTFDMIRSALGDPTPRSLTLFWQPGDDDGTYYDGQIHLYGLASDDDGYDDTVILHETGHYIEDTEGRSDNPGGSHDGSPADPNLAWSEGFSTYWEMAVRDQSTYMDSNANGGWEYDADTSVTLAPQPTGTMSQDVSEDMVTEDLWDLADSPASDDDGVASGHTAVVRVEEDYLRVANLRPVGEAGVDLVDFLDGWFLAQGLTPCAGARGVVTTTRHFPYDYAGPAGACP